MSFPIRFFLSSFLLQFRSSLLQPPKPLSQPSSFSRIHVTPRKRSLRKISSQANLSLNRASVSQRLSQPPLLSEPPPLSVAAVTGPKRNRKNRIGTGQQRHIGHLFPQNTKFPETKLNVPNSSSSAQLSPAQLLIGRNKGRPSTRQMDRKDQNMDTDNQEIATEIQKMDMRKISKQIELLGSSHMTWKQRKELENRKVISLGGKKYSCVLALETASKEAETSSKYSKSGNEESKEREKNCWNSGGSRRSMEKQRPENRVLKQVKVALEMVYLM
ncbi:hypothetical protein Prudu_012948 [Prunus dulcis]|uniref:Uncharacterized protein n=1 Tax=Prunus dulcis TaxID=3755 RepID=A0A4Y1REC3_PRUDU|nr:hypothetical protein Prudu_012948 [Prunus dulcis]